LEFFAERFQTVEVNNAFYRLPEASTFEAWARRTPDDFVVAVKASRYLTHIKRLNDPAEPVARFLERATHLGSKLGPVLLQLPPSLQCDLDRLRATLDLFPRDVRVTVEFRHPSWFVDETRRVLEDRQVALCLADSPRRATPVWRTADWGYLRLHEGCAEPRPCYDGSALERWAEQLAAHWGAADDLFVYFNNDTMGCAVRDAAVFASAVERAGMRPTRVPHLGEVAVG
jgi:uncharacterized protein YecE (DUF72 family)